MNLQDWQQKGKDTDSITEDPLFIEPKAFDFILKPESPALKIGFKPFDYTKAGVYGEPAWIAHAADSKSLNF